MLQIISIISKNDSNNNCSELNFLQKTRWMHESFSLRSGAGEFQILKCTEIGKQVQRVAKCCKKENDPACFQTVLLYLVHILLIAHFVSQVITFSNMSGSFRSSSFQSWQTKTCFVNYSTFEWCDTKTDDTCFIFNLLDRMFHTKIY